MKKLFKTSLLIILAMPFMANKCEKLDNNYIPPLDNDGLPYATQTGENTFGCLINGEPWVPDGRGSTYFRNYRLTDVSYKDSSFFLVVMKESTVEGFDILRIGKIENTNLISGEYTENGKRFEFSNHTLTSSKKIDVISYNITYTKYDTISKVISGNFDAEFKINETNKMIKMEKGRFDLRITMYSAAKTMTL